MTELEELKRLLFGEEQRSLSELEERVENPTTRAQDVASVLAESIALGAERDDRLASALKKPVNECIRLSVQQDTEVFANALFPIMGPAIRKSVTETFKALVQRLNETAETAFSWQGIKWRFESARSGIPVSELALRDALEYRVEQIFLIHRASGLLIRHAARKDLASSDSDAVSAMLTAIRAFVRDSFGPGTGSDLDTADIGDHTVWLFNGPAAILAVVFRGIPPLTLRGRFRALLEELHAAHGKGFEHFAGDGAAFASVDARLAEQLELESLALRRRPSTSRSRFGLSPALAAVLAAAAGVAVLLAVLSVTAERKLARFVAGLEAEPGIVVTAYERDGGEIVIKGLVDPLAQPPEALARAAGYDPDDVTWHLSPYQAMDAPLVARRAAALLKSPAGVALAFDGEVLKLSGHASDAWLASIDSAPLGLLGVQRVDRSELLSVAALAARRLAPPTTIELTWAGGVLSARGLAGIDWLEWAAAEARAIEGVERFDATAVSIDPASVISRWRELLAPPPGVEFALDGERLVLSGVAPRDWIETVRNANHAPVYVDGLDYSRLVPAERVELEKHVRELHGWLYHFDAGTDLAASAVDDIATVAGSLARLHRLDDLDEGVSVEAVVVGSTDASGSPAANEKLRAARAETVAAALNAALGRPGAIAARAATPRENAVRPARVAELRVRIRASERAETSEAR